MNYDRSNDSGRENKKYSSEHSYQSVRKTTSDYIYSQQFRDAEEQRKREKAIRESKEKRFTPQLLSLGKLCAYIEAFDYIPLSEQNIPQVGPFENPTECESFKEGYARGKMLAESGLPIESYHQHAIDHENKYMSNNKQK